LKHPERVTFFSEAGFERLPGNRLPLGSIEDRSSGDDLRIVCEVVGDVEPGLVAEAIRKAPGAALDVTVGLPSPLARLLRSWVSEYRDENLTESLDALQEALDAARREAAERRRQDEESRREGEERARRRRIPRARVFPTDLATSTLDLDSVAESARVALFYSGGDLIGTIGVARVEVHHPDSDTRGARSGSVGGVPFQVSWRQSSSSGTRITDRVTLSGTTADTQVRLAAALRPGPTGSFGYATVNGMLADQAVDVEVHAADGPGNGDAVKIEGTFAGSAVDLYADVLANYQQLAVVRGTCDGAVVHVDISRQRDAREVTGTYEGPTALLVILLVALLSF
jgi:hypothetical protein